MRVIATAILAAGVALSFTPAPGSGQFRGEVVVDRDGLRSFHLAIERVYGVPVHRIEHHRLRRIHPEELPVVYLLAHEGRVSAARVVALRERGWSWIDVAYQLRVDPVVFVSHLPRSGPPHGKAHGYWRKRRGEHLRNLTDRQVVDYVNLAFWAGYHRQPVERLIVIREREGGWLMVGARWSHRSPAARRPPAVRAPTRPAVRSGRSAPARASDSGRRAGEFKESPGRAGPQRSRRPRRPD